MLPLSAFTFTFKRTDWTPFLSVAILCIAALSTTQLDSSACPTLQCNEVQDYQYRLNRSFVLQVLPGFIENQHGTIIFTGSQLALITCLPIVLHKVWIRLTVACACQTLLCLSAHCASSMLCSQQQLTRAVNGQPQMSFTTRCNRSFAGALFVSDVIASMQQCGFCSVQEQPQH